MGLVTVLAVTVLGSGPKMLPWWPKRKFTYAAEAAGSGAVPGVPKRVKFAAVTSASDACDGITWSGADAVPSGSVPPPITRWNRIGVRATAAAT